jgi:hypothetical protein
VKVYRQTDRQKMDDQKSSLELSAQVSEKNQTNHIPWTRIKFKLGLYFLVKYLHMQFKLYIYTPTKINIFLINSIKNYQTNTKFKTDLHFLAKYLYMHFQPYTYIPSKFREQKLKRMRAYKVAQIPCYETQII